MNECVLKVAALLTSLSITCFASAATTEFFDLFQAGRSIDAGNSAEFVYSFPVKQGKALIVTPDLFMSSGSMNLARVDLRFAREYLTPADQAVAHALVWQVASKCMNIAPERKKAVLAWLTQQNQKSKVKQFGTFGPLTVRFERFVDVRGQYLTVIGIGRSNTPGVAPWVNYCEYTGGAG